MIADAGDELGVLRSALSDAYVGFNNTIDPILLEAYILEISALHSKYSLALRNYKSISGVN